MALVEVSCLLLVLYLCYVFLKPSKKKILPPGPPGVPVFGNALQFDKTKFTLQLGEMGRNYGDAFKVRLFDTDAVILNSYDMIKEALMSPKYAVAFSARPSSFSAKYLFADDELFATYSEEWSALRKLVFKGLKHYGSNMADVEDLVQGEIRHLLDRIQNEAGKSVDPWVYISGYISSVISMLITGRHLKQEDKRLKCLAKTVDDMDKFFDQGTQQLMTWLPWLRFVPLGPGKLYQDIQAGVADMNRAIAEDRRKSLGDPDRKKNFMDFMYEAKERGEVTEANISGVMLDLLSAGTGTSRSSLNSLFLILTARPDIQRRIQEEVDEVVGQSRLPCFTDKIAMPYTQAVLWESLRCYPALPFSIPRSTAEEVHIRDYILPKDTQIFYNIWLVLHDEKFWKDPYVFNPSRFLDDQGDLIPPEDERRQRMIGFGVGKRLCVGETLARLRIFLALVSVLQNFSLVSDPRQPLPDTDPRHFNFGILTMAPKYKIVFKPRNIETN